MLRSLKAPIIFLAIMWLIFLLDMIFRLDLARFGIYPRVQSGLAGIVTAPFLHGNWQHIVSNSLIIFVLLGTTWFFYPRLAWPAVLLSVILGGSLIWLFARGGSYHIGASALIYSMAAFLIAMGIFKGTFKSLLIALVIIIMYGGLVYGILPTDKPISWEGHLFGAVAGIVTAYLLRFVKEK